MATNKRHERQSRSDMTLQEFFDFAAKQAATLFRQNGRLTPMWHAIDANDEHLVIATPWCDQDDKAAVIAHLRELFRDRGVRRYVFTAEAWTIAASNVKDAHNWIGRFEKHPDRREVVNVCAEDRDGASLSGWYYILRPEHGPAKLSPLNMYQGQSMKGLLTGLLA